MMRLCLLLACLARPTIELSLQESRVESAAVSAASQKGQTSELEALREDSATLQQQISELSASAANAPSTVAAADDNGGLTDPVEVAFELPSDLRHDDWLPVASKELSMVQQVPSRTYSYPYVQPAKQASKPKALLKDKIQFALKTRRSQATGAAAQSQEAVMVSSALPIFRPNAGKGPETIFFGLFGKSFYGVGLKDNNFVIDIVMTLKWIDKRVIALIPDGLDDLTLSKKESEMKIWLPGMAVTNRAIKAYDLVSTSVLINRKGEVFKVERSTVKVKNQYVLNDYPYDTQKLVVKIASSKYMIDEVVLKPAKEGNGCAKDLMHGYSYNFVDVGSKAVQDVNGALKKSRGLLTITVAREPQQYFQSHLIPTFLITCISCGVFYFPFVAPFITPRVALSILALVAFTNLSIASTAALPAGAPYNWNDCFNQTILMLMFTNVCMNIFSEICFHQLKVNDVATSMNAHCKILMPLVCALTTGTILTTAGPHGWMSLATVSVFVKILIIVIMGSYVSYSVSRVTSALTKKRTLEVAEAVKPKAPSTNPNVMASA